MEYDIGEKPGKGVYECTVCGTRVRLDDDEDRLPPCGRCPKGQNVRYRRVSRG